MLNSVHPWTLFYLLQCSFHFINIMSLRNIEKWLFLSLFSLFSVGTTVAQSAAGSVTPWTQMTSTPARPLAPTSTPHLSHTETWMNRSVIDTRASWSTESETSPEVQLQNIIQFSFVEIIFTKFTLKWFYYLIIVLAHWVKMLATGAKTQTFEPGPNLFYDGRKFRRQCVNMIDKTKREVVFIF